MSRRLSFILLSFSLMSVILRAEPTYTTPVALQSIENGAVYSFSQGGDGAIWMSTNYGIIRFNGSNLEIKNRGLFNVQICSNYSDRIYIPSRNGLMRFDSEKGFVSRVKGPALDYTQCALYAEDNKIWAAFADRMMMTDGDSLAFWCALPGGSEKVVKLLRSKGHFLIASEDGRIYEVGPDRIPRLLFSAEDRLCDIFEDSSGRMWVGLKTQGIVVLDRTMNVERVYRNTVTGLPIREARTFCEDRAGRVFIGTIDGLVLVSRDGTCRMNTDYAPEGYAICSLMRDRDGNIWIGTFYRGAFLCESDNSPFRTIDNKGSEDIKLVNRLLEDKRGDVWVITDRHGLYRYNDSVKAFSLMGGTKIKKFKCGWYDEAKDFLWIGEYYGALNRYDIRSGHWESFPFSYDDSEESKNSIYAIVPGPSGDLFLGTATGVFVFNPRHEKTVSRHLDGYSGIARSLLYDKEGALWIGGNGFYKWTSGTGIQKVSALGSGFYPGICEGKDGNLYVAATGDGVAVYNRAEARFFDSNNVGLADDYTSFAKPISSDIVLIGERTGLSLVNVLTGECYNYYARNGLGISSAREGDVLRRSDGGIWIGGTDGIVSIADTTFRFPRKTSLPRLEGLVIGDKAGCIGSGIRLPHDNRSFLVHVATFDYSGIIPFFCEYKIEGLDKEWNKLSAGFPIQYGNVPPGKYTLRVRTSSNALHPVWTELSVPVLSTEAWYSSRAAVIIYFILAIGLLVWLLYTFYSRMLLAQQLKLQKRENEERMRFFINLSHELRTPLTMIIGQLGLFFRSNKSGVKEIKSIESSYKNAQKMEEIVSELLDFEKRNQGYSSISVSETDLCAFLIETRDWFSQYANYRDIRLDFRIPSYPVPAMIDREQMQRVLSNLLNNAFKFTPDGGEIDLTLAVRRLGKGRKVAEIKVLDTGKGISEGALKRIFDPFYQDPDRKSQGTGIGLAMSKGIVTLHHGSITASNRKGGGAVFCIMLPLGDSWMKGDSAVSVLSGDAVPAPSKVTGIPSEEFSKAAEQKEPSSGTDVPAEKNTMLIVEDDADMRKMLVSIFNSTYGVFEASDGAEGFSLAKSKQPDIIISDVMMPVMDGMSLVAKLRQDFETCHIPVILLTAMASYDNEIEGINKGADDYIGKPFRVDVLEARCRNLLENRNLLRKKFTKTIASFEGLTKTEKDADFLSRAATVIEENLLSSELGVALLCDKLNISRTILDQKIKGITGMTPRVFIETIRMKQACRLLEAGSGNISEIAYMLGFSSPKYFTIRFKKQFGQTPSEWLASRDGS